MISQTINTILNTKTHDPKNSAQLLLQCGINKVFEYLANNGITQQVNPEQVIQLLCSFHYLLQNKQVEKQRFQECSFYWVTNVLNQSFQMERLTTEMSSSSTFARSQQSSVQSQQQQPQIMFVGSGTKDERVHQKRLACLQSFSEKCPVNKEEYQTQDPLTYQQMLQLYYTYLKKMAHLEITDNTITSCYLIQNVQQIGLRIIEGQKCAPLKHCFQLILNDLIAQEVQVIQQLGYLIKENKSDKLQLFEIYYQIILNGKKIKWFGIINKESIVRPTIKQFKKDCREFIIDSKQEQRKQQFNPERLSISAFKVDQYYEYERKQMYEQY